MPTPSPRISSAAPRGMRPAEMREIKPDRADLWAKHPSRPQDLPRSRRQAAGLCRFRVALAKSEMEGRDLVFLIGGHDGLPPGWAARADLLLSLSADDVSARTRARDARRADLPCVRDPARPPVSPLRLEARPAAESRQIKRCSPCLTAAEWWSGPGTLQACPVPP